MQHWAEMVSKDIKILVVKASVSSTTSVLAHYNYGETGGGESLPKICEIVKIGGIE